MNFDLNIEIIIQAFFTLSHTEIIIQAFFTLSHLHVICILCENWPGRLTGQMPKVGREAVPITENFSVMSRESSRW